MNPWKNFAIAYTGILSFTFVFQSLPPLLGLISADLSLDHTQGGLLMGLFALPGVLLTIPGGWLTDRLGVKTIGSVTLIVMLLGSIGSAAAGDFPTLGLARVVAGAGGLILIVAMAGLVSNSFSGRNLGIAMGLYSTGLPLGTIIGFNLFGYVGIEFGWRLAVLIPGLTALVPLALLHLILEDSAKTGIAEAVAPDSIADTFRRTWPLALVWLWFNAAIIGFLTFAPDFLGQIGFRPGGANFVSGLVMWGALIVGPLVGPLMTDRRRKAALILAGTLMPAAILALIPMAVTFVVPLIAVLGLAAALAPAPIFALPAELVGRERQGLTFGILSTSLNVGILIGPLLVGLARDRTGAYAVGFYLMAGFALLAALSAVPIFGKRTLSPLEKRGAP